MENTKTIHIRPWRSEDLELLLQQNTPDMTEYLGGPESEELIAERHKRYLELGDKGCMYVILCEHGEKAGSVGYWETEWENETIYETGWSVLPEYQGKGIASHAMTALIDEIEKVKKYRFLHAFPSIHNKASNAICKRLGFQFLRTCEFEYPVGHMMRCNNWRWDLR